MKTLKTATLLAAFAVAMTAMADGPKSKPKAKPETTPVPASWSSGAYSYDGAGNIYAIGSNDYYIYDGASRLVEATPLNGSNGGSGDYQTYEYDAYGNLKGLHAHGTTNANEVFDVEPATNQLNDALSRLAKTDAQYQPMYDAAGNLTRIDANHYTWDAMNTMVSGPDEEYVYDADDERIATIHHSASDAVTTYTLRGPDQKVLREVTDTLSAGTHNWSWKRDYMYRGDQMLAEVLPGDVTHHFHLDHLGSPRMVSNATGERIATMVYWPFGADAPGTDLGVGTDPLRFTGHEKVPAANGYDLYYMHARYEIARKGRFLSIDPTWESADATQPQKWNRYSYDDNSPINRIDPDGRAPKDDIKQLVGMILYLAGANPAPRIGPPHSETPAQRYVREAQESVTPEDKTAVALVCVVRSPQGIAPYTVGIVQDLRAESVAGDNIDIHHAPQANPASQVITNYDPKTAPGIALPQGEHQAIPTQKGTYSGTARDLVAKDVRDLRNNTNAPNGALQSLVKLIKDVFFNDMRKP